LHANDDFLHADGKFLWEFPDFLHANDEFRQAKHGPIEIFLRIESPGIKRYFYRRE